MVIALLVPVALAGAWVRDPGDVYAKAGVSAFVGGEAPDAPMAAAIDYRDAQANFYAEVGLPWQLQLTGYAPWVVAENRYDALHYVAMSGGDAEVGLSRSLLRGPLALTVGVGAKLPMYSDRSSQRAEAFGAHATRFPVPGDGQADVDARIDAGASLGWQGAWAQGSVGYRHRFGDPVDGVPWSAQVGLAPSHVGWVGVESSGIVNVAADAGTRSWTRFGAFGAVKAGPSLAVEAFFGVIPWATATRTGLGGGLGLSWNRP